MPTVKTSVCSVAFETRSVHFCNSESMQLDMPSLSWISFVMIESRILYSSDFYFLNLNFKVSGINMYRLRLVLLLTTCVVDF